MIEMLDMKETRGLKSNMHSEIENLERKAYNKGYADGKKDAKTLTEAEESCSWSKGVMDAWEYLADRFENVHDECGIFAVSAMRDLFVDLDPVSYVKAFVEERNKGKLQKEEKYVPQENDLVLDPSGNECIVLSSDTHVHVVYPANRKTHKWSKDTKFTKLGKAIVAIPKQTVIGVGEIKF